jgi:hypothetical protein
MRKSEGSSVALGPVLTHGASPCTPGSIQLAVPRGVRRRNPAQSF